MYSTDQKYHLWKRGSYFSTVILCFNKNVLEKSKDFNDLLAFSVFLEMMQYF